MQQTFDTPAPPRLDLRVPAGKIEIDAADAARTEVRLEGPDELLERATVEQRGDTVVVDVPDKWIGLFAGRSREVRLAVCCPEGAALTVRSKSADVVARGPLARADVVSASGDVELDRVEGEVGVRTASGDVAVRDAGSLNVNTASGDVDAGAVRGPLRANVVSGDVEVGDAQSDVSVSSVSGDVDLRAVQSGSVQVQSVSGDVEVGIRRGSRVHVDASTLSGDTRSELELSGEPAGGEGPLVELRLKSVSGDLAVVRAPESAPQEVQP